MPATPVQNTTPARVPIVLKTCFWFCCAIAVLVVARRLVALAWPAAAAAPSGSPFASLDAVFATHARLTLAHIIPALLFVLATPIVLFARGRIRQYTESVFFPLGFVVGLTAYAMSAYAVGGWTERSAVFVFNSFFLYSLVRAWHSRVAGAEATKMRWLLRSIAVLLGIATTRPVMGVFFATSRLTHLKPDQFFGIAFWIGFSINVLVFESWVRWTDSRKGARNSAIA